MSNDVVRLRVGRTMITREYSDGDPIWKMSTAQASRQLADDALRDLAAAAEKRIKVSMQERKR